MGSVDMRVFCPQDGPLEEMGSVDMRVLCPQDSKKMLLKQAKMVYWKKWRV